MTTEEIAAPGAAAELPAPDVQPQVETEQPLVETQQEGEKPAEQAEETEADKQAKAIKAMQRRIDKRTRDLYAERAERERLEREIAGLKTPEEQPSEKPQDIDKLAEQRARELVEQQTLQSKIRATLDKGKSLEGFNDAVNTAIEELGLLDRNGKPTQYLTALLDADAPHELLHYLGLHPEVADSLQGLPLTQFTRRLVKLEDELAKAKAPQVSAAPKPITPVSGAAASSDDPSKMTDKQFAEWRKKQIAARRA
jgi:hypothetical protein